jgi:hypothetical protein
MRACKARNLDLRSKIDAWDKNKDTRKRTISKIQNKETEVLNLL